MWSGLARPHQLCMNKGKCMNGLAALTSCINLLPLGFCPYFIVSGSGLINTVMHFANVSYFFLIENSNQTKLYAIIL